MAKRVKYTDEFRKNAVRIYLEGDCSAAQLSPKLGVHKHTLCNWIRIYSNDAFVPQPSSEQPTLSGEPPMKQSPDVNCNTILACIRAIKEHITELEELLLQQADSSESDH